MLAEAIVVKHGFLYFIVDWWYKFWKWFFPNTNPAAMVLGFFMLFVSMMVFFFLIVFIIYIERRIIWFFNEKLCKEEYANFVSEFDWEFIWEVFWVWAIFIYPVWGFFVWWIERLSK
jgi:hypothetical protein